MSEVLNPIFSWYKKLKWKVLPFQQSSWEAFLENKNGLINAPTGSGKTHAALLACLAEYKNKEVKGIQIIWITPIRALAKEISLASKRGLKVWK